MAGWFDNLAKRSAQRAAEPAGTDTGGLSRREVLARGAVVAGVAWTAPMLMATQAAAVGLSVCPMDQLCGPPGSEICCPNDTDTCQIVDGVPMCIEEGDAGGSCGNQGVGICNNPFKCNGKSSSGGGGADHCNSCAEPNICGGEGALCCTQAECFDDLQCVQQTSPGEVNKFCRQTCTPTGGECNTGQVCSGGFCGQSCVNDQDCGTTTVCSGGVCTYRSRGGAICPPPP